MKLRNLIPFVYSPNFDEPRIKRYLKTGVHLLYSFGLSMALINYGTSAYKTGEFNPLRQTEVNERMRVENQLYQERYNQLFGKNGFADVDRSGAINFDEKVEAWRLMGFGNDNRVYMLGETEFPKPNRAQLEWAIERYQEEGK